MKKKKSKCCILTGNKTMPTTMFSERSPNIQSRCAPDYGIIKTYSIINSAHKILNRGSDCPRKGHEREGSSSQMGYGELEATCFFITPCQGLIQQLLTPGMMAFGVGSGLEGQEDSWGGSRSPTWVIESGPPIYLLRYSSSAPRHIGYRKTTYGYTAKANNTMLITKTLVFRFHSTTPQWPKCHRVGPPMPQISSFRLFCAAEKCLRFRTTDQIGFCFCHFPFLKR